MLTYNYNHKLILNIEFKEYTRGIFAEEVCLVILSKDQLVLNIHYMLVFVSINKGTWL